VGSAGIPGGSARSSRSGWFGFSARHLLVVVRLCCFVIAQLATGGERAFAIEGRTEPPQPKGSALHPVAAAQKGRLIAGSSGNGPRALQVSRLQVRRQRRLHCPRAARCAFAGRGVLWGSPLAEVAVSDVCSSLARFRLASAGPRPSVNGGEEESLHMVVPVAGLFGSRLRATHAKALRSA